MQPIAPVTPDQLLAPGQVPLSKLELFFKNSWVNICNLFSSVGLVGWWPFDEGAGMVAYDKSKYGNDGSLENMTEEDWVDGKVGKCLDFDGDDDYVEVPRSSDLEPNHITVAFWIRWSATAGIVPLAKRELTAPSAKGYIFYESASKLRFRVYNSAGASKEARSGALTPGVLYHIAGAYDGANVIIYVDAVKTVGAAMTGNILHSDDPLLIGAQHYSGTIASFWDGLIDEVRIYNRALTEGEIKALFELKGKNYLESASVSLGGASMTPNPVGGAWNAMLGNKNSIFHPKHPTSAYKGYCVTGRKARMSIGATYGGTDYYWQRLIGFMDEPSFEAPSYKVSISGADYMKVLEETKFKDLDNYWGTSAVFSSIASDGLIGSEIYNEVDAMDINNEANNVTNWVATDCAFVSFADAGGGSTYVGRLTGVGNGSMGSAKNLNIGSATAGKEYKVAFKHRGVGEEGDSGFRIQIRQASGVCNQKLYFPTDDWKIDTIYFTALDTGPVQMWIISNTGIADLRVDQFSFFEYIPYEERYYELPGASKGPHYVTLDVGAGAVPVWQGEGDEDWDYPTEEGVKAVYFNINKVVPNGVDNLVIYYFTAESLENVVADVLVKGHLYADRAAAIAAMEYTATGITIDKVLFKAGSTYLNAVKKLCERCDYRFHFKYDGIPVFKPKPAPGTVSFAFTDPKHIAAVRNYQDRSEIKNRIIIKGIKQADPASKEETMPSELMGEAHDQTSIDLYGERTMKIDNDLFQDQASIDAMCATLLAEYKDPKLYADVEILFRPVPLELGDKMSWKERLSPVLDITQEGVIRDIKIDNFNTLYRCEI